MNTYKVKYYIKPLYSLYARCRVFLSLPFVSHKVNITLEDARKTLEIFSPDSRGTIEADNQITPDYDIHIIIPCYNVERYVDACLNSVFSQRTNFSYFVTIINDGSTDATFSRIQHILARLPQVLRRRVELINQPNAGLSAARNAGLKHIRGQYVMFVDSDDKLYPRAIENLLTVAFSKDAQIVVGTYTDIDTKDYVLLEHPIRLHGFAWGKVFKSEIFHHLKFPTGICLKIPLFPVVFILHIKRYI